MSHSCIVFALRGWRSLTFRSPRTAVGDNKRLSKEMSQWLAKESDAVEAGLGDVANSDAMDMAIADAAGDPSRHVRTVGPMPGISED